MKTKRLRPTTRLLTAIGGLLLLLVLLFPIWRIDLWAPQYPEGLSMWIHANKLSGDVGIISGLNHYIGMRGIHEDDFKEFMFLPYVFIVFSALALLTALINRKWILYTWVVLFTMFAIIALIDFYIWLYDYGHNLNPEAPIKVPGMTYMPPILGSKQLLNFIAYSIPATGGWIMFGVEGMMLALLGIELKLSKKKRKSTIAARPVLKQISICLLIGLLGWSSCSPTKPKPINFGEDACDFCYMTISDNRYGAELITKKGRVYKFDDLHCLKGFINKDAALNNNISSIWFVDFSKQGKLIPAENSFLLQNEHLQSPMGSNIAVFGDKNSFKKTFEKHSGEQLSWSDYIQSE